jgi:hypothetical protein
MSNDAKKGLLATPEENAEVERILSEVRADYLQRWREQLLIMRAQAPCLRAQIDDLLEEVDRFECALI